MTTPVDDLQPIPPQPEISEGNKVFHEKSYNLYVWMRTRLAPALEYVVNLVSNFMSGAYNATSTTSMVLGTGSKTITVQAGRSYVPGNPIRVAYTTDPNYYADGIVTAYNSTTGALTFDSKVAPLTGTYALWTVSIIPNSTGLATLGANEFSGSQTVPDEAYSASGWNGNNTVPTKNAVRDIVETLLSAIAGLPSLITAALNPSFNSTSDTGAVSAAWVNGRFNVTGSAPLYACRAWVNFNGTGTAAIRASGNVSSITDNGAGDYTVNFITAMPDANYAVSGTSTFFLTGLPASVCFELANSSGYLLKSPSQVRIGTSDNTSDNLIDANSVNVEIFR